MFLYIFDKTTYKTDKGVGIKFYLFAEDLKVYLKCFNFFIYQILPIIYLGHKSFLLE